MITMINIVIMLAIFLAGLLLGGVFFGGLLWTVRRGLSAKHPELWFLASRTIRFGVVLGAFYLIFNGRWERLMVCVSGFLIARMLIIQFARTEKITGISNKEVENAPQSR